MNIQRVATEVGAGPVSRANRNNFDVTITDQGIRATEVDNSVVRHEAPVEINGAKQIASTADLQAVLSPQESEALARSFAFLDRADADSMDNRLNLYNGRGNSAMLEDKPSAGTLLDVVG